MKIQIILIITVFACLSAVMARPVEEGTEDDRRVTHARTSARKRHADIHITSQIARNMRELNRMLVLNNLVGSVEPGKNISLKVIPDESAIPDQKDVSNYLLSVLNGEKVDGLKVRVVGQRPVTIPKTLNDFIQMADQFRQQAVASKTCIELQKTIMKNPSLRIRVKCKSEPIKRSIQRRSFIKPGRFAYRSNYGRSHHRHVKHRHFHHRHHRHGMKG